MSDDAIKLAVVGCGRQMKKNLLPFLQRVGGHRIVASVDPDEALGREVQEIAGAPRWIPDARELEPGAVDAAVVAVPPGPSQVVTEHLMAAGIPCFVEKPAGPSTDALRSMAETAQRRGAYAQVGFNFRFAETVAHLHEISADQRKSPYTLTIDFYSKHPSGPQWGCDDPVEAWIRQNGVHALDMARWFAGSPTTSVTAHVIPTGENKFLGVIALQHENRALSILRVGNQTRKFIIRIGLHCVDGTRYSMPSLERVKVDFDRGFPSGALAFATRNLDHGWSRSGFGPELSRFVELVRSGGANGVPAGEVPTLEDAAEGSALCDRVMENLSRQFALYGQEPSLDADGRSYAPPSTADFGEPRVGDAAR